MSLTEETDMRTAKYLLERSRGQHSDTIADAQRRILIHLPLLLATYAEFRNFVCIATRNPVEWIEAITSENDLTEKEAEDFLQLFYSEYSEA
jgi:hypothetical protein